MTWLKLKRGTRTGDTHFGGVARSLLLAEDPVSSGVEGLVIG